MTAVIAFQGPLSGDFAWVGEGLVRAARLALGDRRDVTVEAFDSRGRPDEGRLVAERLATDPRVVAVLGPTFSREADACGEILDAADLPFVLSLATNPELGERGWSSFFRIVASDRTRAPLTASFMRDELRVDRAAVASDDSESGRRLAGLMSDALEAEGVEVARREELARGGHAEDAAERITAAAPGGVFFGGEVEEAAALRRALGRSVAFVSDDGVLTPRFVEAAGQDAAEGAFVTSPCAEPGGFSAEARAATLLLAEAIETAGADRAAVTAFLRAYAGEPGGRRVRFTPAGENAFQTFFVHEVVDGSWTQRRELTNGGR